jgi:hypothetical protein
MSAPETLRDLLFPSAFVTSVCDWIRTTDSGVLVIEQSQPGAGVSTLWDLLETELPGVAIIRQADAGVGKRNVLGQKNVMVFDDMDADISNVQKMKCIGDCLALERVPIVFSGFHRRGTKAKIGVALKKVPNVTTLPVPRVTGQVAIPYLQKMGHRDAERAWYESRGDLRQCIRSIAVGDVSVKLPDGVDALTELLNPPVRSFTDRARVASGDITIVLNGIFENYPMAVGRDDLQTCTRILDCIGVCADLDAAMYDDPTREFYDHVAAIMGGVSACGPLELKKPITTYGTVWARHNHANAKKNTERQLVRDARLPKSDMPYVRQMVFDTNERRKTGESMGRGRQALDGIDPDDLWRCTTLFQPEAKRRKYTKAQHTATFIPGQTPPRT